MAERRMRIIAGSLTRSATLLDNATADAIWNALPLEASANRWGDELYFDVPVELDEPGGQEVVAIGDVAYWPPGKAVCIFWGPTPASQDDRPRAASPVNVFARVDDDVADFGALRGRTRVRLEQA